MHAKDICNKRCTLGSIGLCIGIIGALLAIFGDDIFDLMLSKELTLRPNSRVYDAWKSVPIPISIDIYFFNWTNPQDFENISTKPILEELGPYRFTEKTEKVDIDWHQDNGTVSFRRKSTYFFDEEGSRGSLDDQITTLNVVALSAAETARYWNFIKQKSVSVGLNVYEQQISITKKANELLFEGYQDNMIDMAREFPIFGDDVTVPFDRFGWFYPRNGTADLTGYFNVYTGEKGMKNFGQMNTWNYKKETGYYQSYCGQVNGSAGEFYPPRRNKDSSISFFSADLCRSINLYHTETVNIEGLEGFKYSGDYKTVDNGTLNKDNNCFCNGECVPSGVLNISSCRFGTPVFMSFPHYYNADNYYLNQVEGLKPSKEKHEFYITLEPLTGIPLEVAARLQINMLIRPSPNIALYKKAPHIFLPLLWFEQKVRIQQETANELLTVLKIPKISLIISLVIMITGFILALWFPIVHIFTKKNKLKKNEENYDKKNLNIENLPEISSLLKKNEKIDNVIYFGNKSGKEKVSISNT